MFLIKRNATGSEAVEYIKNKSSCNYKTMDDQLNMDCSVKVNNYGKNTELIFIYPNNNDDGPGFKPKKLSVPPHSQKIYSINYTAAADVDYSFMSETDSPNIKIDVVRERLHLVVVDTKMKSYYKYSEIYMKSLGEHP
ncbi:hypothetical protein P4265_09345 [Bacillus velezensis]|uniref:hypothetical protein n=1 Tax=Bacillus velezensis TaxID=492670 RepID=UPI002E207980|nr:hypothetical protein [Bacillus velezensis]